MFRKLIMLVVVCLLVLVMCGCQEEQQWGTGDPTPAWQKWFANDNQSRLLFVQEKRINSFGNAIMNGSNKTDALTKRVEELEAKFKTPISKE